MSRPSINEAYPSLLDLFVRGSCSPDIEASASEGPVRYFHSNHRTLAVISPRIAVGPESGESSAVILNDWDANVACLMRDRCPMNRQSAVGLMRKLAMLKHSEPFRAGYGPVYFEACSANSIIAWLPIRGGTIQASLAGGHCTPTTTPRPRLKLGVLPLNDRLGAMQHCTLQLREGMLQLVFALIFSWMAKEHTWYA
ncbi:hypothetical protein BDW75DRAFT_69465 [Aspergillus navahoensis]